MFSVKDQSWNGICDWSYPKRYLCNGLFCSVFSLEHFGYEIWPNPVTVGVPRQAKLPLVLLVLMLAAKNKYQGGHDGEVVH